MSHRSIIIQGVTTSLSMEPMFWQELDEQAVRRKMKWQAFTRQLLEAAPPGENRSAFLKTTLLTLLKKEVLASRAEAAWQIQINNDVYAITTHKRLLIVGRGRDCDILLNDVDISRQHLLLAFDGNQWWAMDMDSKNGVWYRKKRFSSGVLKTGMQLKIGNTRLALQ